MSPTARYCPTCCKPTSITVLRLQWSDTAENAKPPMHSMRVGPTAIQADVGLCQMQRLLGQHQQRAGDRQIVALDKADQGEHGDDQDVVAAERDVVERPSRRSRTR